MKILLLILSVLTTWRISNILVNEDGPFDFAKILREKSGIIAIEDLPPNEQMLYSEDVEFTHNNSFFAKLFSCIWCISVWVGFVVSMYLGIFKLIDKKMIPLYTFALSALTIFIDEGEI